MNRLLSNVFNSIKEINRLGKEINRLLNKAMSNIYLKGTIDTFSKIQISGLKRGAQASFGELRLTHISLNLKTFCCNLSIRCLGAKRCVAFLLI